MSLFKKLMALVVGIFLLLVLFFGGFVVSSFSSTTLGLLQDEITKSLAGKTDALRWHVGLLENFKKMHGVAALSESSISVETVAVQQDEVFKENDVLLGVLSKSVVETSTVSFETKKAIEKLNKSVASLEVAASKFKI